MSFFLFLGCPECFPDRDRVNPYNQKKMEELYEDTIRKVDYLEDRGFEVVQKWECELKKEMKEDEELKRYIDEHELVDPLQPREAFYGGVRTLQNYITIAREMRRLSKCHRPPQNPPPFIYTDATLFSPHMAHLFYFFTGMSILLVYTRGAIRLRTMSLVILKLSLRILQTFLPTLD